MKKFEIFFKSLTNGVYDNFWTKHDSKQNIYDYKIKMTQI